VLRLDPTAPVPDGKGGPLRWRRTTLPQVAAERKARGLLIVIPWAEAGSKRTLAPRHHAEGLRRGAEPAKMIVEPEERAVRETNRVTGRIRTAVPPMGKRNGRFADRAEAPVDMGGTGRKRSLSVPQEGCAAAGKSSFVAV
jgi:hypothetical protein